MTILESSYMNRVPAELKRIADGLAKNTPRLVKVNPYSFLNPANISSLAGWEVKDGISPNNFNGRVSITMTNGDVIQTSFLTVEEAISALGM